MWLKVSIIKVHTFDYLRGGAYTWSWDQISGFEMSIFDFPVPKLVLVSIFYLIGTAFNFEISEAPDFTQSSQFSESTDFTYGSLLSKDLDYTKGFRVSVGSDFT